MKFTLVLPCNWICALGLEFAAKQAREVCCFRTRAHIDETVSMIREHGAIAIQVDVTSQEQTERPGPHGLG